MTISNKRYAERLLIIVVAFVCPGLNSCSTQPESQNTSSAKPLTANSASPAAGNVENSSDDATIARTDDTPPFEQEGFISDSTCGGNHEGMLKTGSMGATDTSCVLECVRAGSRFVFVSMDGKHIYRLKDQDSARQFAGQKVRIKGQLCSAGREVDKLEINPLSKTAKTESKKNTDKANN